jgi:hypothetical protein
MTSQYVDSVRTLSEAITRRGRIFHQEMNLPVYNALKGLAIAVQVCHLEHDLLFCAFANTLSGLRLAIAE